MRLYFRYFIYTLPLIILLLSYPSLANEKIQEVQEQSSQKKWHPYFEIESRLGSQRVLGETSLFIPIQQNKDTLIFTDFRFRFDTNSSREGNFGIGLRTKLHDKWIGGIYGFYDIRRTRYNNLFHQATLGTELIAEDKEARINFYLPQGGTREASSIASINSGQIQIQSFRERALPGFDTEIGAGHNFDSDWSLWGYAGGYYFHADGFKTVSGPRVRVEASKTDIPYLGEDSRLTFGIEVQSDDQRGFQSFALARLKIPLLFGHKKSNTSPPSLSTLDRRMIARINRDVDIVTEEAVGLIENATISNPQGTRTYTTALVADANTVDIDNFINTAGENSLIIIDGTFGDINPTSGSSLLPLSGQMIAGGGHIITATGSITSKKAALTLPGVRPNIQASNTFATIAAFSSDVTLAGLNLSLTNNDLSTPLGIVIFGSRHALIGNNINSSSTNPGHTGQASGLWAIIAHDSMIIGNNFTVSANNPAASVRGVTIFPAANVLIQKNDFSAPTAVWLENAVGIAEGSVNNTYDIGNCNVIGTGVTGQVIFRDSTTCP